jgi:hypothetical protein
VPRNLPVNSHFWCAAPKRAKKILPQ